MLNSIITCNAFLERDCPVLNSHNNFQKEKALFFEKNQNFEPIFFTLGSRPLNLVQICDFQNVAFFKALNFDRIFQNAFILHF